MALDTQPLFVTSTGGAPDFDELKARLRLSGLKADADAEQILHSVLQGVRANFYARLGVSRVLAISTQNPVVAPANEAQIIRAIAYECEVIWVIVMLMHRLPMMFMDASGGTDEFYNTEGVFRSMDPDTMRSTRSAFEQQIEDWLAIMDQSVPLGNVGGPNRGRVYTQIPQAPKTYPGGSLRGENIVLFTNPEAAKALGLTT